MPRKKADRTKRIPLGSPHRKLNVAGVDFNERGTVGRWINDSAGRLQQAQQGGYDFVQDPTITIGDAEDGNSDLGSSVSRVVGKNEDGTPLRAYLMEIPKEMYDEDQKAKQAELDKVDEAIQKGQHQNTLGPRGYVPPGGIIYNPRKT